MSNTNVVVVGGGPAGSAAAIWCAKSGLKVTLIEFKKFPRDRPGETLHPGIEPLFEKLGIAEEIKSRNFIRHRGSWVKWNKNLKFIPFGKDENGPWLGFQIMRADLDIIMLTEARRLGVNILQPYRAYDVITENNRVAGVKLKSGEYRADFVIDAAGDKHWLAKKLKLSIEKNSSPMVTCYGYVEGKCEARDEAPSIIAVPGGWVWTAKVRENLYQWTRLSFMKEKLPNSWLPDEFEGMKPTIRTLGADVTWRRVVQPAGPGYFTVGDAAAILDPASSHGVIRGIMSGMQAAHAIVQTVKEGFPEKLATKEYNNWLSEWFLNDVFNLKELYQHHPNPPKWV